MSLDNIHLSSFLLQDLYNKSLVDLDSIQSKTGSGDEKKWRYLGMNEKNILIIVDDNESLFLSESKFDFILEIFSACKLSMNEVVLINIDKNPGINYQEMIIEFIPEKILLFGVEPGSLQFPLLFPHYQLQKYNQQIFLSAPSLEILSAAKPQKVLLWNCLKKLFLIN